MAFESTVWEKGILKSKEDENEEWGECGCGEWEGRACVSMEESGVKEASRGGDWDDCEKREEYACGSWTEGDFEGLAGVECVSRHGCCESWGEGVCVGKNGCTDKSEGRCVGRG